MAWYIFVRIYSTELYRIRIGSQLIALIAREDKKLHPYNNIGRTEQTDNRGLDLKFVSTLWVAWWITLAALPLPADLFLLHYECCLVNARTHSKFNNFSRLPPCCCCRWLILIEFFFIQLSSCLCLRWLQKSRIFHSRTQETSKGAIKKKKTNHFKNFHFI